jgi:hypothetical protein
MLVFIRLPPEMLGKPVFLAIVLLMMVQGLLAGGGMLDCISKERREGTLGLLFLTRLRGADVVVGKMAAGSLKMLYRLLAFLPVVAITFLMGGVGKDAYLAAALVCLATALFSLCLAVFCSSLVRSFWSAFALWLAGLLMLCVGLPLSEAGLELVFRYLDMPMLLPGASLAKFLSPAVMYRSLYMDWVIPGINHGSYIVVTGAVCLVVLSLLLFGGACWFTMRSWKDKEKRAPKDSRSLRKAAKNEAPNDDDGKTWKLKDHSPLYWLLMRYRSTKVIAVSLIMAGLALLLTCWLQTPEEERSVGWGISFIGLGHFAVVFWMAAEAAAWTSKLRQSGELELLVTTPLSMSEFWRGYRQALLRKSIVPVALLFFAYWCFATSTAGYFTSIGEWLIRLSAITAIGLLLPVNMAAAGWTGAWFGTFSKNELYAALAAIVMLMGMFLFASFLLLLLYVVLVNLPQWLYSFQGPSFYQQNSSIYRMIYEVEYFFRRSNFGVFLFMVVPWLILIRSSLVFLFWSRKHCHGLRYAVQADGLRNPGWRFYTRIFRQSLYRSPKLILEGLK